MKSQEIKLTKAGATLPRKEIFVEVENNKNDKPSNNSSIIDVSHETSNIWKKSF